MIQNSHFFKHPMIENAPSIKPSMIKDPAWFSILTQLGSLNPPDLQKLILDPEAVPLVRAVGAVEVAVAELRLCDAAPSERALHLVLGTLAALFVFAYKKCFYIRTIAQLFDWRNYFSNICPFILMKICPMAT